MLLGACEKGFCSSSCECNNSLLIEPEKYAVYTCSHPNSQVTNGDTNDQTFIHYNSASRQTWFEVRLPTPSALSLLLVKGSFREALLTVVAVDGTVTTVGRLHEETRYRVS